MCLELRAESVQQLPLQLSTAPPELLIAVAEQQWRAVVVVVAVAAAAAVVVVVAAVAVVVVVVAAAAVAVVVVVAAAVAVVVVVAAAAVGQPVGSEDLDATEVMRATAADSFAFSDRYWRLALSVQQYSTPLVDQPAHNKLQFNLEIDSLLVSIN